MNAGELLLGLVIFLPLLGALVTAVAPTTPIRTPARIADSEHGAYAGSAGGSRGTVAGVRRTDWRGLSGALIALATAAASIALAAHVGAAGESAELAPGGWGAPLGVRWIADGLGVMFVALTGLVGLAASVVAVMLPGATGAGGRPAPAFWPLWLGCWTGLNTVHVSGDFFNIYVGLELAGLTAVGLVALGGRAAWAAAFRYLIVTVVGSMLFLLAVGLIASDTGTLDFRMAADIIGSHETMPPAITIAVLLGTAGMALKFALAPLHGWLIPAHSSAPSVVSPLLSALVIKAPVVVLLRLWTGIADESAAHAAASWILGAMGVTALLWGSIMAIRQTSLKKLIAYSTVAQAGYWVVAMPIIGDPDVVGQGLTGPDSDHTVLFWVLTGTVALIVAHGLAKAALFLVAGLLKEHYGTDDMDELSGAGREHPMLAMTAGLSAIALAGMPPSLAFGGKWQVATGAVMERQWWILAVVVVSTLLSVAYLLRILAPMLRDTGESRRAAIRPTGPAIPPVVAGAALALAVAAVASGFIVVHFDALLQIGGPA
ncbi:oxidoreductase [Corynebacterium xerosis]|uniref:Oxidoreductase n=1 Tax=Corynebacterium xerosis TaxID=1725 RepID=A0A2N6T081_9CORY|nr:proton-conducting transporter membrane subunit [Corynebacterium xerosis]PMC62710.1 oxidoreductase [Corynebacterium xerosis]